MAIAGITPHDKRYMEGRRRQESQILLDELYSDLQQKGFELRHQPMDDDGRMALFVSDNSVPNLKFLFTVRAECSELLELTGRKAAFHVESAATRQAGYFYAGDPENPKTGMAEFLTHVVQTWGHK